MNVLPPSGHAGPQARHDRSDVPCATTASGSPDVEPLRYRITTPCCCAGVVIRCRFCTLVAGGGRQHSRFRRTRSCGAIRRGKKAAQVAGRAGRIRHRPCVGRSPTGQGRAGPHDTGSENHNDGPWHCPAFAHAVPEGTQDAGASCASRRGIHQTACPVAPVIIAVGVIIGVATFIKVGRGINRWRTVPRGGSCVILMLAGPPSQIAQHRHHFLLLILLLILFVLLRKIPVHHGLPVG